MIKSGSFNGLPHLKQLILSKDSFLIGDEELYQLIKDDYHEKQTYKALRLVKPYLHISFSNKKENDKSYKKMLKDNSNKSLINFHIFQENSKDNTITNEQKLRKSIKFKRKNNIPLPNLKTDEDNLKNTNTIMNTEIKKNNLFYFKKWAKRSLSKKEFTIESPKNKKRISKSNLNRKVSLNRLLSLRSKFFSNEKMTRGELTEMMFGNKIPFYKHKNICDDMQKKVYEVLSNNPKLILDLLEKGYVDKKDVIDYFNIKSINIEWNDELEKIFREIGYNKRKTNSNMLKTTFFLVNIGFHKVLKQKFEEKNYKTTNTYNQAEIEEFSRI